MRLLQNLKALLAGIFPLRLNKTVKALEESLSQEREVVRSLDAVLTSKNYLLDQATTANHFYMRDNLRLRNHRDRLMTELDHRGRQLADLYGSMTPKLSTWPIQPDSRLERDAYFHDWRVRVYVPPVELSMVINQALRNGNHPEFFAGVADELSDAYKVRVRQNLIDLFTSSITKIGPKCCTT